MKIVCTKLVALAGVAGGLLLVHASPVACAEPPSAAYQHILELERARSLGAGYLAKLTFDSDPALAARAALALGRTRKPEAREPLLRCLSSASAPVRAMCAFGLGLVGVPNGSAPLILLANDAEPAVRYAVADALGRIVTADAALGTGAVATTLYETATRDGDAVVRGHAAIALVAFAKSPLSPTLSAKIATAFAGERDPAVRERLMWTAGRGFAATVPLSMITSGLLDPFDLVRATAVRALGKRKDDPAARQLVLSMIHDPSWRVQYEAREALLTLAGKPRTAHLAQIPAGVHVPPAPGPVTLPAVAPSAAAGRIVPPVTGDTAVLPPAVTSAASMQGEPLGREGRPKVRVVTTKGSFTLELFSDWAPYTVANFLSLAKQGYFTNDRWFRVVPDFVVQTGDHSNTGEGDAGYMIGAEENPIEQTAGVISMGLNYDGSKPLRDSAGSQFYLTLSPQYHLDGDFTVFGKVVDGFNVLPNLIESDTILRVELIV